MWLPVELAVSCSVSLVFETLAWWLSQSGTEATDEVATKLHRLLTAVRDGGFNS